MIQLLEVRLCVAKLAEDLFGAGGGLDKCLVVGERQLLRLSLQIKRLVKSKKKIYIVSPKNISNSFPKKKFHAATILATMA
jgi:hypothetical protein